MSHSMTKGGQAFGHPGIPPRWTSSTKEGVGTAYHTASRVWFTLSHGILNEIYYPTIDRPQVRDFQYLVTDGEEVFHEEKRHLLSRIACPSGSHVLHYRITNTDPEGRYTITKEIITDPHLPCLLQQTQVTGQRSFLSRLHLYVLCAPHLEGGGWGNNAYVVEVAGRKILAAEKQGTWLVLAATLPFSRLSCGYVGHSDGWTDLTDNFQMDWQFDQALDGNVALTGEIVLDGSREFTLGLAFGGGFHSAITTLFQALSIPFNEQRTRYVDQWHRPCRKILPLEKVSGDAGTLYRRSYSLLLAHEDKTYPGALIASLSIPSDSCRSTRTDSLHLFLDHEWPLGRTRLCRRCSPMKKRAFCTGESSFPRNHGQNRLFGDATIPGWVFVR